MVVPVFRLDHHQHLRPRRDNLLRHNNRRTKWAGLHRLTVGLFIMHSAMAGLITTPNSQSGRYIALTAKPARFLTSQMRKAARCDRSCRLMERSWSTQHVLKQEQRFAFATWKTTLNVG